MKKKLIWSGVLLLALAAVVLWYKMPIKMMELSPEEVAEIVIFDGNSGKTLHITETEDIEHVITNLDEIKLQREKCSLFYMGYSFQTTIYLTNGEEADGWNNFIINGENSIRKDPFFYRVTEGKIDYEYIQALYEGNCSE